MEHIPEAEISRRDQVDRLIDVMRRNTQNRVTTMIFPDNEGGAVAYRVPTGPILPDFLSEEMKPPTYTLPKRSFL